MKRDYWLYPESNLIIEKYYGVINKEDFDRLDGSLLRQVEGSEKEIKALADLSSAHFFNIKYDDLKHVFDAFVKRVGANTVAKIAFFNGENAKDDYLKISQFTKFEAANLEIESFLELPEAMKWLELSKTDQQIARQKLLVNVI